MTTMVTPSGDRPSPTTAPHRLPEPSVITSARTATSRELSTRVRRYTLAMAFRMACFLAMIVVDGWLRWVLLTVAVFMPYLAVVLANQADQRSAAPVAAVSPELAPALTTGDAGSGEVVSGEVIDGFVVTDEADPVSRAA